MLCSNKTISVCARGSKLSRIQVEEVHSALKDQYENLEFDCTFLETIGDKDLTTPLTKVLDSDFFTREIDNFILEGKADISIHSAKDLPDPLPEGLQLIAITKGVDPSDALVLKEGFDLTSLPQKGRIGTSSKARHEAITKLRSDLVPTEIRGPVDKRCALIEEGVVDGIVVAKAALIRLGFEHLNIFDMDHAPHPMQGKLAIVAKSSREDLKKLFLPLDSFRNG